MNRLELALLDPTGLQLDFYLEETNTKQIRSDIEAIRKKAALSTDAGALRQRVLAAIYADDQAG